MKVEFNLDLLKKSYSISHTSALSSRKLPFTLEVIGHYYGIEGYFTEREGYNSYLILLTISGQGFLRYRDKDNILKAGSAILIHCEEYHYYKTLSNMPWEIKWIHINGMACSEYFDMINENAIKIIELSDINKFNSQFNELLDCVKTDDLVEDINISRILNDMITDIVLKKLKPPEDNHYRIHMVEVERVIGFIEENYNRKINIDDFVDLVHISKYHFLRIFKKFTSVGPYEYLTNYRIKRSKLLLKDTDLSINEISSRTGYQNVNNFIRDFKKYTGITPNKYRMMDII